MTRTIALAGNPIEVEVAENDAHRYKGLSDRDELGKDEGMMFVWPMEKEHGLVMRDMNFGIDMVFADAEGEVTKVHSANPDEEGTTAFSKYAVELPKGYCEAAGVEKGDRLELDADGLGKSDTPISDQIASEVALRLNKQGGEWVEFQGPEGGTGWQNTRTQEVRYQDQPPGEVAGDGEDNSYDGQGGDNEGEPEWEEPGDPADIDLGQPVVVEQDGQQMEGVVDNANPLGGGRVLEVETEDGGFAQVDVGTDAGYPADLVAVGKSQTMNKVDLFKELEGVSFYSEINDTEVKVVDVEGDKVRVTDEDNEWWERMEDVRDKITDGAWEEKDDPCWDGYEMQGTKEQDGETVPNCVPKSVDTNEVTGDIAEKLSEVVFDGDD